MNNLVMTIEKMSSIQKKINNNNNLENIEKEFEKNIDKQCYNKKKKVTFSDKNEIKYVDNYIKNMDKIMISKKDLQSLLNIIKIAIVRKTFKTNEIKIVVDFHNRLNNILNN